MHLQSADHPVFDQDRAQALHTERLGCRVVTVAGSRASEGNRMVLSGRMPGTS